MTDLTDLRASDDLDALRLLLDTADAHNLPDDYEVKVTVLFMRGLAALLADAAEQREEIERLHALHLDRTKGTHRDLMELIERAEAAEARVAALETALVPIIRAFDLAVRDATVNGASVYLTHQYVDKARAALASPAPDRAEAATHGRHCSCSACANEDWTRLDLAPCGIHGPDCPNVYAPDRDVPPNHSPVVAREKGGGVGEVDASGATSEGLAAGDHTPARPSGTALSPPGTGGQT